MNKSLESFIEYCNQNHCPDKAARSYCCEAFSAGYEKALEDCIKTLSPVCLKTAITPQEMKNLLRERGVY